MKLNRVWLDRSQKMNGKGVICLVALVAWIVMVEARSGTLVANRNLWRKRQQRSLMAERRSGAPVGPAHMFGTVRIPWPKSVPKPAVRIYKPIVRIPNIPRIPNPNIRVHYPGPQKPNIRVPDVNIPDIQIPDFPQIQVPDVRIPQVEVSYPGPWKPNIKFREFNIPDTLIPDVPDVPEIQIPEVNVPQVEVPNFPSHDEILRPALDFLRRLKNIRISEPFLKERDRDWRLTWGWFGTKDLRTNGRPLRVEPEANIGGGLRSDLNNPMRGLDLPIPSFDLQTPSIPSIRPDATPPYKSLCNERHYSARRYRSTTWIGAPVVNATSMDTLRRIKGYFMGQNDQGKVIRMSPPLKMTVTGVNGTISDTEDTLEEFRLSARIPVSNSRRVPRPTDPMLSITREPAKVYFSTGFRQDRRPGTPAIYDEFFELQNALELARESFEEGIYHSAFYETWADIVSGKGVNSGEVFIPAASGENLVCTGQETSTPQNGIKQCGDSRCPDYVHLEHLREDVELRMVKSATYITRKAPACTLEFPAFVSHCALKRYLKGANSEGQRYPSPAPFIHYIRPSQRATSFCKQTAISAYVLPPNATIAEPTESDLRILNLPDREAYVIKFGGRPDARTVERKVDELRDFLNQQGLCFVRDRYAVAVYDHPFNRPPHLNEVLILRRRGQCGDRGEAGNVPTVPTSSISSTTTETDVTTEQIETTSVRSTTRELTRESTTKMITDHPSLIEIDLTLESNSVEDLIPYRFSGNQTDFPEDFPVDVFVF